MEYENRKISKDLEYGLLERSPAEEEKEDEETQVIKAIMDSIKVGASITGDAVVDEKNVYFGCNDCYVYCLRKEDGKLNWKFRTSGPVFYPTIGNGVLYFGSFDGHIYAADITDGTLLWKFKTRDRLSSPATLLDGRLYICSLDKSIYALTTNGNKIWSYETKGMIADTSTVVNDRIFFSSVDKNFYCLSKDGELIWKFPTNGFLASHIVVDDKGQEVWKWCHLNEDIKIKSGSICFGSNDGFAYLVDLDGNPIWKVRTEKKISGMRIVNNTIYAASYTGDFYAFSLADGSAKWKFPLSSGSMAFRPEIKDGIIYMGCTDNNVYAIDAETGAPLWKFRTNGMLTASPTIDRNILYVGSWDGFMYALDIKKQEVVWKFQTGFAPSKPISLGMLSKLTSLKNRIRFWHPEQKPKSFEYEKEQDKSRFTNISGAYAFKPTYTMEQQYTMKNEYVMKKAKKFPWEK